MLLLSGCSAGAADPSAETTARRFWSELASGAVEAANARCVSGTRVDVNMLPTLALENVTAASESESKASVLTRLTLPETGNAAEITTYLERQERSAAWQVDCTRTLVQLQVQVQVDAMVERVRTLSETFSAEMEQGAAQLRRTLPALEESLGRELERVEEEVMRTLPGFMQRLEEFSRAVDETLRQLPERPSNDVPKRPPSGEGNTMPNDAEGPTAPSDAPEERAPIDLPESQPIEV